jgi:glycosyltransferase involved in cell wall biosynthesis
VIRVGYDVTFSNRVGTGVGVYARHLEAALASRHVVGLHRWERATGPATTSPWRRLGNGARLTAWLVTGCARRARRDGVDLVHATAPIGPLRVGCPVVMTVHDATAVTMPARRNPAEHIFHRAFSVRAARRADALLVPSQAAADDIVEHYRVDASRIRVVPLGVADTFRQATAGDVARVRRALGLDRPYVLYVGADAPRKNLRRLVAAKASDRRLDDLDLVIAGPAASAQARLDASAAALGLPRPIRWLSVVRSADLPGLYAGASCLAYVSLWEGFGLPIVEAMAAGTPVVTSSRGSMPEVAGDAAVLVDPTDVPAIADAIVRLVHDTPLAARLRRLGTIRSAAFTWDATARLTEAVYFDVAGKRISHGTSLGAADEQRHGGT